MKAYGELLLAALLGAVITFGVMTLLEGDDSSTETFRPDATELVAQAVLDTYGYKPEVGCPDEVPAEEGYVFQCEALVDDDRLVPVDLRVLSPLGFIEVVRVG